MIRVRLWADQERTDRLPGVGLDNRRLGLQDVVQTVRVTSPVCHTVSVTKKNYMGRSGARLIVLRVQQTR